MKKVTGIGGIFFKAEDPKKLLKWYLKYLGLDSHDYDDVAVMFGWKEKDDSDEEAYTVWSPFKEDTRYFDPSEKQFMINFRVENLEELLEELDAKGITIVSGIKKFKQGKFAWILDPEDNKIELWEPAKKEESK